MGIYGAVCLGIGMASSFSSTCTDCYRRMTRKCPGVMASQPHCWIAGRWNREWANNARYTSCTSVLQFVLKKIQFNLTVATGTKKRSDYSPRRLTCISLWVQYPDHVIRKVVPASNTSRFVDSNACHLWVCDLAQPWLPRASAPQDVPWATRCTVRLACPCSRQGLCRTAGPCP